MKQTWWTRWMNSRLRWWFVRLGCRVFGHDEQSHVVSWAGDQPDIQWGCVRCGRLL